MAVPESDCNATTGSILAKHRAGTTAPALPPLRCYEVPLDFTSLQILFESLDVCLLT